MGVNHENYKSSDTVVRSPWEWDGDFRSVVIQNEMAILLEQGRYFITGLKIPTCGEHSQTRHSEPKGSHEM